MILAGMIATDEDALMADFLEYYHVADWRAFPVKKTAALAFYLSPESRIKRIMSGRRWSMDTLLLAALTDRISTLIWMLSEDSANGQNRPKSIYAALTGEDQEEKRIDSDLQTFDSGEDFLRRWKQVTNNE